MSVEKEEPTDQELLDEVLGEGGEEDSQAVAGADQQDDNSSADDTTSQADDQSADEGASDDGRPPKPEPPAYRLKEEAERRRQVEQELANERATRAAEKLDFERRLKALEKPAPEPKTDENEVDPLIDPKAYKEQIRKELREEILSDRREASLQAAHKTYKGEFEEAYKLAGERVDPALKAKMQASRDPGETLIAWYREQKTVTEIGGDLNAYKQRLREEALKDPEFRKAAMEAWKAEACVSQPNGRPRVDLPPSLNGASRANAAVRPAARDDASDEQLFEEITAT